MYLGGLKHTKVPCDNVMRTIYKLDDEAMGSRNRGGFAVTAERSEVIT